MKLIELSRSLSESFRIFGEGISVEVTDSCQIIHASINPDMDELSGSDVKMLDRYITAFRDMKSEELSELESSRQVNIADIFYLPLTRIFIPMRSLQCITRSSRSPSTPGMNL